MQTFIWNVKWQYVGRTGASELIMDKVGDGNVFKMLTTMKNNTFINNVGLFNENTDSSFGQPLKLLHNTIFNSNPNNSLSIPPNTRFYFQYQLHEIYNVNNIKIQFDYSPNVCIPESDKTFIAFIHEGKIIPFSNPEQNAKMNEQTDNIYTSYTASDFESNEYFTKDIIIPFICLCFNSINFNV